MVVKEKNKRLIDRDGFQLMHKELKKVLVGLSLRSISLAKNKEINGIPWEHVLATIRKAFIGIPTKLIACLGTMKYPAGEK